MGNSTKTLQNVIDYVATIGDLNPVIKAAGFSNLMAQSIGDDVMTELLAQRFNWKFNRIVVPPFLTNSWQQDYATVNLTNVAWLEHTYIVDINNTALPKPIFWLESVRDLERSSYQFGRPAKVCWLPNDQLTQDVWPGAATVYTNPLGQVVTPTNKSINILDANGNILILTTYGTTGGVAPLAASGAAAGVTVADGSCVWTVANPKGKGFRVSPLPPQQGITYQVNVIAQARPVPFTSLGQTIDPVPDDYAKYFIDGYIAYCHRHSSNPVVRNRFAQMKQEWMQAVAQARGQGDRERDDAGFVPDKGIMQEGFSQPIGPAWPFGPTY